MKILITGDLVVSTDYDSSEIQCGVKDLFLQSDLNIVNLEAPTTVNDTKILKTGPHLKSDKISTLGVLKRLEIDIVTLANNHVLDYDQQGVVDTLNFCNENNIQTVGADINLEKASKILYHATQEGKIAFVNFAENEWASATENTAGANPMDLIENTKKIEEAKQNADFVFVIVHGGHEYYNLPSPRMQKQYRFYAEQGADIVIGHHTHCISGYEMYNNIPIFYSLGNFLFTRPSSYEDWYVGVVLEIEISKNSIVTNLHPVKQSKSFRLELMNGVEKETVLERIATYNNIIGDITKLNKEWNHYIETKSESYINYWSPLSFIKNRYIRALFSKGGFKLLNKRVLSYHLNLIRSEAHADLSKEVIRRYLLK